MDFQNNEAQAIAPVQPVTPTAPPPPEADGRPAAHAAATKPSPRPMCHCRFLQTNNRSHWSAKLQLRKTRLAPYPKPQVPPKRNACSSPTGSICCLKNNTRSLNSRPNGSTLNNATSFFPLACASPPRRLGVGSQHRFRDHSRKTLSKTGNRPREQ